MQPAASLRGLLPEFFGCFHFHDSLAELGPSKNNHVKNIKNKTRSKGFFDCSWQIEEIVKKKKKKKDADANTSGAVSPETTDKETVKGDNKNEGAEGGFDLRGFCANSFSEEKRLREGSITPCLEKGEG